MKRKSMREIAAVAQDELRDRVLNAIHGGMTQAQASRAFGIPDRTIRRWVARLKREGTTCYVPAVRGRRPGQVGKLSEKQAERIKRLVVGKMPDQLKLPFYLWTREAVGLLIGREYGVALSRATIGNYLKAWGLTPQKPVRRAYERDDVQIAKWLDEQYPQIARRAKRNKALIYWGDESGLRSDDVRGRSYALKGKTPEIRTTGKRFGVNMISALSNQGGLAFQVFEGRFVVPVFIGFMERLLKHAKGRKVVLIVDGHPVHKAKAVKRWLDEHAANIEMHLLPGYAPELNPDELLNHDVKLALSKSRPRNRADMKAALRAWLHRRQKQPDVIRNFFDAEHVRYAA
jgi:transposase